VKGQAGVVTCQRAGRFSVTATASTPGGQELTDSYDVECVTPRRLEATTTPGVTYLANASLISVDVSWFGQRSDGSEVRLRGSLPVTLAPGEREVAIAGSPFPGNVLLRPKNALARSVMIRSAGLATTVPVRAIDSDWRLRVEIGGDGPRMSVSVTATDTSGAPVAIRDCSLIGKRRARRTSRGPLPEEERERRISSDGQTCSAGRLLRNTKLGELEGGARPEDWFADDVCATVLDQMVCAQVPR
jgi:hypothetical protein